jgi:hypothetical protein
VARHRGGLQDLAPFILPALVAPLKTLCRRTAVAAIAAGIFIAALLLPWPFAGLHAITDALRYRGASNWWGIGSLSFLFHDAIPASVVMAIFYAAMTAAALLLLYWWVATIVSIVRAGGDGGNVRTIAP